MDSESDTEKYFIENESRIYYNNIIKSKLRDKMLTVKNKGYSVIKDTDINIFKIFMGYLYEINLLNNIEVLDDFINAIIEDNVLIKITKILNTRKKNKFEILEILRNNKNKT